MRLPMTIEDIRLIEDGLWEGKLQVEDFRVLHAPSITHGAVSVIVVNDPSLEFDEHAGRINFDLIKARLANRGDTDRVIIVSGCAVDRKAVRSTRPTVASDGTFSPGDERFLHALRVLPRRVRRVGEELLNQIRSEFEGGLKYHPITGSYVQTPDKFWAVRIQPQDRSLRIVVRGEPDYFGPVTEIELRPDRASYSSFKIWKRSQLPAALAIIRMAQRE